MLSVLSSALEIFDIAKLVVVALVKSVLPVNVVEAIFAEVPTVKIFAVSPPLNVLRAEKVLAVVVPNAVEIVTAPVEPEVSSGYVAAREITPVLVMIPVAGA